MRLICPNADEIFVNSATFPSGHDLMESQIPRGAMERIGVINRQVLDRSESEAAIQSSKRPLLEPQTTMQSATTTAEQVSRANTMFKSGRRPE